MGSSNLAIGGARHVLTKPDETPPPIVRDGAEPVTSSTIQGRRVLRLTRRDTDFLIATVLEPPSPGPRLRQAAARHRDHIG